MLAAAGLTSVSADAGPERPTFNKTTEQITLDGRLDETSWRAATPVNKFFEIYPADRGIAAEITTATFLYDDRHVYVAIRALDHDPAKIRAPVVRRDLVLEDQDYVEVFLDPLNTRRSALFFRVNAFGILTDGHYDDKDRLRDYSPDFDFDAAASIDERGWSAEIRIPLSSLRYQPGVENPWGYVVYRNLPRQQTARIASSPIPRGETCDLCYANVLDGISVESRRSLSVIPHIEYTRLADELDASSRLNSGVDVTWKPRENTVVDATVFPDFSQIEADVPQLTANTQFALAVIEKRPFFLEGIDLLTTQIPVVYTRAFADPDVGLRITDRSSRHEYTALALRDAGGGGTVIEPGPLNSRVALQDFESTALVARNRVLLDDKSLGMLASARFNDDGSHNVVIGADGTWTPSVADQITAQFLRSQTRNPTRPDLLDVWTGQHLDGNAGSLAWTHNSNDWHADVTYKSFSSDFRAWNGFVTQVGVSSFVGIADLYFYPENSHGITRFGPRLTAAHVENGTGARIIQYIAPGFVIRASGDTTLLLNWYPRVDTLTLSGPRTYTIVSMDLDTTPFPWMPHAFLTAFGGKRVDNVTGIAGDAFNVRATIPLRFSRLEIKSTVGYQTFQSDDATGGRKTLFTERTTQVTATWHFSSKLSLRVTHQRGAFDAVPPFAGIEAATRARSNSSALLLSYQTNWRTRYYVGASWSSDDSEPSIGQTSERNQVFAKISYAFSN
jgi:hypothetical protein